LSLHQVCRGMCCAVMVASLSALVACTTVSKKDDQAAQQALQEKVNESMAAADKAQKMGQIDQAISQLDIAIKTDPSAKQPWLKKAQIHFDARQYGQAITEAQEVLQRDVSDLTAKSILAVSGLRVSADALEQLRKANEVNGSARSEAESVAKIIREALGEPILIAAPAAGNSDAPAGNKTRLRMPANRSAAPVLPASAVSNVVKTAPAPVAKPAPATSGRNNPFGVLQ
jgi:tetratricopeptide (TPR) repeat protein